MNHVMTRSAVLTTIGFLSAVASSQGPPLNPSIIGTWQLVAAISREIPSGAQTDVYGSNPHGYLMYSADGRMMALIVRGDRKKPAESVATPAEAEALFRSMLSYTGTYIVNGDRVIHHVDASWNELWTGTDQVRIARFQGDRLTISTEPSVDPFTGKYSTRQLVWTRLSGAAK